VSERVGEGRRERCSNGGVLESGMCVCMYVWE
jgi:hypothetical protein